MVRLGQMFSNLGSKIKDYGLRMGSTLTKIAPKALHYGKMVAGGLSNLPGFIGTAAGTIYHGLNAADKVINALPNSQFKDKLKSLEAKGEGVVNNAVNKASGLGQTAKVIGDSAGKILNSISPPII